MSIRIVTDSTCDLPISLLEDWNITVIPLYIHMGTESYLDGVEITREAFYRRLPHCTTVPKTAAPGSEVFAKTYRDLAKEGASEILSIHISPTLSAVLDVARMAANEVKEVAVTVLDSRQLSMGAGFIALEAASKAAKGLSMPQIIAHLKDMIPRVHVFAALSTMKYLRRSGRVSWLVSGIGGLLNVKPLLKMNDGLAKSERVRTNGRAIQRLIDLVLEVSPVENLALVHTNAQEKAEELWNTAKEHFPSICDPVIVDVTPVLGVHLGPGAVGFACVSAAAD